MNNTQCTRLIKLEKMTNSCAYRLNSGIGGGCANEFKNLKLMSFTVKNLKLMNFAVKKSEINEFRSQTTEINEFHG